MWFGCSIVRPHINVFVYIQYINVVTCPSDWIRSRVERPKRFVFHISRSKRDRRRQHLFRGIGPKYKPPHLPTHMKKNAGPWETKPKPKDVNYLK